MDLLTIVMRNPALKRIAYTVLNSLKPRLLVRKKINGLVVFYRMASYDPTVIKSIFYLNSYEYREFKLRKGDIVLDVGAHIGAFTLYASRRVGDEGLVLAFEPDIDNYNILRVNLNANNISNVIALNVAVGSTISTVKFTKILTGYTTAHHIANSPIQPFFSSQPYIVVDVGMVTIDFITRRLRLDRIDYIKVDAEGYEIEVLKGALNTINNYSPNIVVDVSHYPKESEDVKQFIEENTTCKTMYVRKVLGEKILFLKCA